MKFKNSTTNFHNGQNFFKFIIGSRHISWTSLIAVNLSTNLVNSLKKYELRLKVASIKFQIVEMTLLELLLTLIYYGLACFVLLFVIVS